MSYLKVMITLNVSYPVDAITNEYFILHFPLIAIRPLRTQYPQNFEHKKTAGLKAA
jgi:hypothetical protein